MFVLILQMNNFVKLKILIDLTTEFSKLNSVFMLFSTEIWGPLALLSDRVDQRHMKMTDIRIQTKESAFFIFEVMRFV